MGTSGPPFLGLTEAEGSFGVSRALRCDPLLGAVRRAGELGICAMVSGAAVPTRGGSAGARVGLSRVREPAAPGVIPFVLEVSAPPRREWDPFPG